MKLNNLMEVVWFAVFILCLVIAIKQTIETGFIDSLLFYAITLLSLIMYFLRRFIRKNKQKNQ
ncbi:MAG: hypothetical protein GVY19_01695 [Bacteroidetes bacterium]|nr:hypothetical protein [Bacteroidota bacterium]